MSTVKLYQQDVYRKECRAEVLSAQENRIVLDQSVFFPVGGGQSCDMGTINGQRVVDVFEEEGVVYHCMEGPVSLRAGDEAVCRIDWDRRFDNMQRHCGEHILSGICYREFGGVNRGFHMGQDYMTVDISLEEDPSITEITWEMAKQAELYTNEVIWSDAPVTTRRFETREEAAKLPLRKALAIDEEISIVCVGDINNAADCVACCGTHPSSAGQVGLVKIYKVEHYKGMFRIYFEAGKRALLDYDQKHDLITSLGNRYSAGPADLLDKIAAQEQRGKQIKDELHALRQTVIRSRIEEIRSTLKQDSGGKIVREFDDLKAADLSNLGKPLTQELGDALLLLAASREHTLLLFSGGAIDCGKLIRENASLCGGKGGGNASSARASFPDEKAMKSFLARICFLILVRLVKKSGLFFPEAGLFSYFLTSI